MSILASPCLEIYSDMQICPGQTCSKVRKFKKLKTQLWEGKGWGAFLSSYVKQIHSTLSRVLIKLLSSFKQRRD